MPYDIRKSGRVWCLYNKETSEKKGCHPTYERAVIHKRTVGMQSHEAKS